MAMTEYPTNHPLAVKKWAMGIGRDILQDVYFSKFMGEGSDNLVQIKTELSKGPGDTLYFGLRHLLSGDGVTSDNTAEGNEEALVTSDDALVINQLRHSVRSRGKMSEQRIPFEVREEARVGLKDWWTDRLETIFFNHICGNTAETRPAYRGFNTITAPTTGRKLYSSVDHTSDETLDSSDTFNLDVVDAAIEYARTANPKIRPLRIGGGEYFVMFLHEYSATDLRRTTSAGDWFDIQRAAMEGGKVSGSPIFTTALGEYHGVIFHRSKYLPLGINSSTGATISTVRRNVLCGAQAAVMGFGRDNGPTRFNWVEKKFDYDNQLGVSSGSIFGLKKTTFTYEDDSSSFDYGTIVVSSYAAAHTF